MKTLNDKELQKYRDAARLGPPRESCKVLKGDKIVPFGKLEHEAIGSYRLEGPDDLPLDLPLYGQKADGPMLRFKKRSK